MEGVAAEPTKRKRRPWWRWNLTVLAAVLFVTLWSRELLRWHYTTTWLVGGAIVALWLIGPWPFVERERIRRMPQAVLRTTQMLDRRRTPMLVHVMRHVGRVIFFLASLQFVGTIGWLLYATSTGQYRFDALVGGGFTLAVMRLVSPVASAILPALGGGILYLLAVIAQRLYEDGGAGHLAEPANSPQAADSSRSID